MDYTINEDTFAVSIIDEESVILEQPTWPNGEAFESVEDAELWAAAVIESYSPEATHYAPNGRNEEPLPKPTQADLNAWHERRIALDPTLEEFRNELIKEVP